MTDEELAAIDKEIAWHDSAEGYLSLQACCDIGTGRTTRVLLAEVRRLREQVAHYEKRCSCKLVGLPLVLCSFIVQELIDHA